MKWLHNWSTRVLFLLLIYCPLSCNAFEVAGFKSGISLQEAQTKAAQLGDIAKRTDAILAISRPNSETRGFDTYILFFCENRLYQLNHPGSFTASSFINLLTSYISQYGTPDITSGRRPMLDYNHLKEVEFKWRTESDTITLWVNSPEKSDSVPKLGAGMIQVYVDTTIQCPRN